MKYARTLNGRLYEVTTIEDPLPSWAPDVVTWLEKIYPNTHAQFFAVPDDNVSGATDNGDGTYTNPTLPTPPVLPALPAILSSTAFQDVTETALGGGSTGRTRFGEIIRAMSSSADDEVLAVSKRYDKSLTFERAKVSALLTLLVSKGIVQASERSAVLAAWPT